MEFILINVLTQHLSQIGSLYLMLCTDNNVTNVPLMGRN